MDSAGRSARDLDAHRAHDADDAQLFRELYPSLRRFAAVVGPIEDDPDDLVQEALVRALAGGPLSQLDHPAAYLRRAITNLASNRRRKLGRWRRARVRLVDRDVEDPHYPSDLAFLDGLQPLDRAVLYGVDVERRSSDEVAEELGLTSDAVRSRAKRARRKVRDMLRVGPTEANRAEPTSCSAMRNRIAIPERVVVRR